MPATAANLLETMRYTYAQPEQVLYLFNQESVSFNMLKKHQKPVGGRGQFIMPIMVQNAGAWTGIAEGGSLPSTLAPDSAEATWSLVEFVGLVDLTWKLIQDSNSSKFAFKQGLKTVEDSFRRRIARNVNMDLIGDGLGKLGIMSGADNQTTITFRALPGCDQGMVVDLVDASDDNTKLSDSVTVNAINVETNEVTFSGSAPSGTAAGDYIVIQDTVTSTVSRHTHGLLGIFDNANPPASKGNVGSINRSTSGNEYWEAAVFSNSGGNRALTEDLLLRAEDMVRIKGGGKLNAYLSNNAILRRYHELVKEDVFFAMGKPSALDSGVGLGRSGGSEANKDGKTIYRFSGVPWHVDPYFDSNRVLAFDTSHVFIGHGDNETPMPESEVFPGRPFFRQTSSATYEVAFYWQGELISDAPSAGAVIEDLLES